MADLAGRAPAESQEFYLDVMDARVPRFFGRDPDRNVVNVLSQR